jgi:septal ring factor EnvC (AmiA/AmiB activator)
MKKVFFFERKKPKAFVCLHLPLGGGVPPDEYQFAKVFWFFFSKKNILPLAYMLLAAAPRDEAAHKLQTTEQLRAAHLAAQAKAAAQLKAAEARADLIARRKIEDAAKLRGIEAAADDARARLQEAAQQQSLAARQVKLREAAIEAILPVVVRLSLYPAETILAAPVPRDRALEGLLATKGLSAELAAEIRALHAAQDAAAAKAREVTARESALSVQTTRVTAAETALDRQLVQTRATETEAERQQEAASHAAADLAAQAANLRDAIAAMDRAERQQRARKHAPPPAPAGPGLALATGHAPVTGAVLHAYGSPGDDGPATGITFAATPGAFVTSPCSGKVAFAAPFRSYGRLMIIECGRGYDVVLAGLARLDAAVGHNVRRGEPVGRMPDAVGPTSAGLYLELRLNGRPVDPAPFLNAKA